MAVYEYKEANVLARLSSALTKWRTENFLPTAFPAVFGFHHHRLVRKFPDPTNLNLVLINVWSDRPSKCFRINHFQTNRPNISVRDSLLILRIFSLLHELLNDATTIFTISYCSALILDWYDCMTDCKNNSSSLAFIQGLFNLTLFSWLELSCKRCWD